MGREPSLSLQLPPGFRFHPSDEELIIHYLQNKVTSRPLPASIIAEIDLYKYNPWELRKKALFGEEEWFFFSPRNRKYPNGARPNRAAGSGYWKATGTDKPILTSSGKNIGVKKALVFYLGRPPKGVKTDWIMNEYRLLDTMTKPSRLRGTMRLDDWVLCRVREKGNLSKDMGKVPESEGCHSIELLKYLPKIEEHPTHTNYNMDMIMDFLNKDCQLLASILADQALPPIKSISGASIQGSTNGDTFTSVYEGGCEKVNSPVAVSSLESYFNPLKRKPAGEGNGSDNLLLSNKITSNYRNEETLPNTDLNYYSQSQSQGSIYNPSTSDGIIDFQELDRMTFTENYLQ